MKPDVSIIIPVYNVEKYINRCVDSIINQTYKNIEIILVDDGSTDSSKEICDNYKVDNRVVVIHKRNGGLSSARNEGIKNANGDYIMFVDSDDYSEPNYVETMFNTIKELNSDLVVCGYYIEYVKQKITKEIKPESQNKVHDDSNLKESIYNLQMSGCFDVVWNKLYRKEILSKNSIVFEQTGMPMEDFIFNCEVFKNINKVVVIPELLHRYLRQGEETLVRKTDRSLLEKTIRKIDICKNLYSKYDMFDGKHKECFAKECITAMFACVPNMYRNKDLKLKDKINEYSKMISNEDLMCSINLWKPDNTLMKFYVFLLKLENPIFMSIIFGLLFFIRNNFEGLYSKFFKLSLQK